MAASPSGVILAGSVRHSHLHPASPGRLRCQQCSDVIGVYEPLVVVGAEGSRTTSLAAEPGQFPVGSACFHAACHERMSDERTSADSAWSA